MVVHLAVCRYSTTEGIMNWEESGRAGGMAQVAERLPKECEALSSNSSIAKKKKKKADSKFLPLPI
jgi:hypothetical protein